MGAQKSIKTTFGEVQFFEKSVRISGIAEILYFGLDPLAYSGVIISLMEKLYKRGRVSKLMEIQEVLKKA